MNGGAHTIRVDQYETTQNISLNKLVGCCAAAAGWQSGMMMCCTVHTVQEYTVPLYVNLTSPVHSLHVRMYYYFMYSGTVL